MVRTLAGLLRVAIGLDRSHAGMVERLRLLPDEGPDRPLVVEVSAPTPDDIETEIYSANERRGLLEQVLDRDLEVRATAAG